MKIRNDGRGNSELNYCVPYRKRLNGFTLVEMAIVIVIIGLILTTALGFATSLRQSSALSATLTREQAIKTALTNFIAQNNRFPCPAIPTAQPGTAGYGVEDTPEATSELACPNSNPVNANRTAVKVVTGIVPWVSLGLTDDAGSDGYNNRFTYQVVQSATFNTLTSRTVAGIVGDISVHSTAAPAAVLGTPASAPPGNQSNYCGAAPYVANAYNPCAAVAIIVSHGSNGTGGFTRAGVATTTPIGSDELQNSDGGGGAKFVMKDASSSTTNPFDDIVLPLTANDLLSPLTMNGSLQSANAVLANDFENITAAITANAISTHTSCSGAPFILAVPATVNDPWGNVVQINFTTTSITSSSTGTAFMLTSRGPDGITSSDDVALTIPVSQLSGPFNRACW